MAISALIKHRLSALLATGFVGVALVVAGCGGSSGKSSHATAHHSAPKSTTSGHHAPSTSASSGATAGIPQGNGGDQDPDNNGGPSDGDGNV
ncbi:MAG: hypothetical protein ACTHQQ_02710 [Solirubrobacteraceae bacterium]